ncbi:MAG: undecaprenyl-phosphate galactose phosphotransferase WbaP [Pirellulaceae bacterium]|nr:undecaprenyl-phosphate galactose phosphotransferase WbaP [Pirellulaceae bacterium]
MATLVMADVLALATATASVQFGQNLAFDANWLACNSEQAGVLLLLAGVYLALSAFQGAYAPFPLQPAAELRRIFGCALCAGLVVIAAQLLNGPISTVDLAAIGATTVLAALFVPVQRAACRMLFGRSRWWGVRVILVGSGGASAKAMQHLLRRPHGGLRPVGFVADGDPAAAAIDPEHYLGGPDALPEIAARYRVGTAVVSTTSFDAEELAALMLRPDTGIAHWIVLPPWGQFPTLWTQAAEVAGVAGLSVTNRLATCWARTAKRSFDLAITLALGLAALPVFALLSVLVRLSSPGPVFYSQERIGLHGRRFRAWKFRSMLANADEVLAQHLAENPDLMAEWQATHKLKRDPRVTWIGYWLRKTSLDELPQVWNVLCGEMSLVGPRPIVEAEIDKYADCYAEYARVLPGITGLWQINGRNNTTYDERVDFDAYYVRNWSPWLDLYILGCTVKVVLLREGAY